MYDLLKVTMLGLFFGTFGTTLGGIIGVRFQNPSNKILSFILSLAGGLMTSILSFDLIPEALNYGYEVYDVKTDKIISISDIIDFESFLINNITELKDLDDEGFFLYIIQND